METRTNENRVMQVRGMETWDLEPRRHKPRALKIGRAGHGDTRETWRHGHIRQILRHKIERCRCEKCMDGDMKQNCKLWRLMSRDSDMKQRDYVLTYTPKAETKRQTLPSLDQTWDTCAQHRVLYTVLKRGTHMLPS